MASINELWDIGNDLNVIELVDNTIESNIEIVDNETFFDFEIEVNNDYVGISERSIITDGTDKLYTRIYTAHTRQNKQCSVNKLSGLCGLGRAHWTNADYNGYVTHRINGDIIVSTTINNVTRSTTLSLTGIPDSSYGFISNNNGWARTHVYNTTIDMCNIGGDLNIYTTQDHTTPNYIRNSNCWADNLDLTAISPWNSYGGANRAGVLITPRHILMAAHYMITIGSTIRFIKNDNTIITRTLIDRWNDTETDLALGLLDSDVPSGIGFVKCLPSDWESYFIWPSRWLPVVKTDKEEKFLTDQLYSLALNEYEAGIYFQGYIYFDTVDINEILSFYEIWESGDSGSPCFMIINNELVILCCATVPLAGPAVHYNYDKINTELTNLGGGYQLTPIDLTSFRSIL